MAGELMSVFWDRSKWEASMRATTAAMGDMTPIMAIIGEHMEGSIKRTLTESGSPAGSFAPVLRGGKPLIDTGQSILAGIHVAHIGPDRAEIGSGFRYSGVHQFGATIRAKSANYLTFQVAGRWARKKEVTIPARPFMVFRPEDPGKMGEIAAQFLNSAFGTGSAAIWGGFLRGF